MKLLKNLYRCFSKTKFSDSAQYWRDRYAAGGNSGAGSYGQLAEFKATKLNEIVAHLGVGSVLEFGSGDGAQLSLAKYPSYLGVDISSDAVTLCQKKFAGDTTKVFQTLDVFNADPQRADMTMSLDVLYHLVEDQIFDDYMARLFDQADRLVAIYASNSNDIPDFSPHVRHRKFTDWIEKNRPDWTLIRHERNPHAYSWLNRKNTSPADLYLFRRG